MKSAVYNLVNGNLLGCNNATEPDRNLVNLVLCFGGRELLQTVDVYQLLSKEFLTSVILLCSTAGEICCNEVKDESLTVTAIAFEKTEIVAKAVNIANYTGSFEAAKGLMSQLDKERLCAVLVFSDGSHINGSKLVKGLNEYENGKFLITGGIAGDGGRFETTLVGLNEEPREGIIAAIGLYSDHLVVTHGSQGGWDTFGMEKTVTRSKDNILYEIDGKNALDLYIKYLGPDADGLPGSALLFPISLTLPGGEQVVRTILAINKAEGSMTFAGDIPEGAVIRLMKANFDKLIGAASEAGRQTLAGKDRFPDLALLISCVGRKLILQSRTEEEIEALDEVFDHKTLLTGFYSYGEISPNIPGGSSRLHNQTMTITSFYEA